MADDLKTTLLKNPPENPGGKEHFLVYPPGLGNYQQSHTPYVRFSLLDREAYFGKTNRINSSMQSPPFPVVDTKPATPVSITLPLPTSGLRTSYKIDYEAIDLGEVALADKGILGAWNTATKAFNQPLQTTVRQAIDEAQSALPTEGKIGAVASNVLYGLANLTGPYADAVKAVVRKGNAFAFNPFTEQLFKTVQFRVHDFEFIFLPKREADSEIIDAIIRLFRWYMHPQKEGGADFRLAAPNEFLIAYSVQDTTFGLLPSVLESMDVDYGGSLDSPRFFVRTATSKQYPTKITMNLRFKETIIMTRNSLDPTMVVNRNDRGKEIEEASAPLTPTPVKGPTTYNFYSPTQTANPMQSSNYAGSNGFGLGER